MVIDSRCSIDDCVNWDKGLCDLSFIVKKQSTPNDKKCKYHETSVADTMAEIKEKGGMQYLTKIMLKPGQVDKPIPVRGGVVISKNPDDVKRQVEHNGFIIKRMVDRSYEITNSTGKKINAKPLFIKFVCELDQSLKMEDMSKKGTRPLGNLFLRLKLGPSYIVD